MWACDKSLPVIPAPDVVGLGVLIAFVGSSSLAVIGLFIQYLFFYSPHHEVLARPQGARSWTAAKRPNPIDAVFLLRFRYVLRQFGIKCNWIKTSPEAGDLQAALDQCILTMADVQLGMGVAMLIYGFTSLSAGLSAYTWWNIVGLVWFSLITNLVAHSYLRTYYLERPGKRRWRLCLVIALMLALIVAMVPTARMRTVTMAAPENQSQLLTTRALCYFPRIDEGLDVDRGDRSSALAAAYVLALLCLVSISSILLRLYERPGSTLYAWCQQYRGDMRKPLCGRWIECMRCEHRYLLLAVRPYLAFWLVLRLYTDLLNSILTELLCSGALLAWVTLRYFSIRAIDSSISMEWSLTQLIALVFFAAPLKGIADYLFAYKSKATSPAIAAAPQPRKPTVPRFSLFKWLRSTKKVQEPEQPQQLDDDEEGNETQPMITPATHFVEDPIAVEAEHAMEPLPLELGEVDHAEQAEGADLSAYKEMFAGLEGQIYFGTPWFPVALPTLAFATVLYITVLFALPLVNAMLPTEIVRLTGIWYLIYHPALILIFFLTCMAVEERTRSSDKAQATYRTLAAVTMFLSAVAVIDTIFGLGGIPMSYVAMGALGLCGLIYVLYGCVTGPGRLAKGKDRSYMADGDVEDQRAPLLGPRPTPNLLIRSFPVRKPVRYHGPAKRARGGSKLAGSSSNSNNQNYGTIA
ncbi:pectate lyase superfamily protein-domain-containing protein [Apiospora arundinis]